jgi:hypothetical protein
MHARWIITAILVILPAGAPSAQQSLWIPVTRRADGGDVRRSARPILVLGLLGGLPCPLMAAARLCINRDGPKSNALRAMAIRVSAARS